MKKKNLLLAGIMILSFCVMNQFANAQIKPDGKKYKCQCSLPNYGCKSYSCFADCARVCTIIMIKPTNISFPISKTEKVSAQIFDATGRLVKAFPEKEMQAGNNEINWDEKDDNGNTVSPGVYFIQINANNYSETKKFSVIK